MDQTQQPVLVYGGGEAAELSRRMLVLGFRALPAAELAAARALVDRESVEVRAALVDVALPPEQIRALKRAFPGIETMAVGREPDEAGRKVLRELGFHIGLWSPVDPAILQFCLSQATLEDPQARSRRHGRVPTDLSAVARGGFGQRTASVHEMSTSGAFLATFRPLDEGTRTEVELRLPDGIVRVASEVVWANTIGTDGRRGTHPTGMAVRFENLADDVASAIADYVGSQLERFRI